MPTPTAESTLLLQERQAAPGAPVGPEAEAVAKRAGARQTKESVGWEPSQPPAWLLHLGESAPSVVLTVQEPTGPATTAAM